MNLQASGLDIDSVAARLRDAADRGVEAGTLATYEAAWAALALRAHGRTRAQLVPLRAYLAERQLDDGRVALDVGAPDTYWPTALAALAWLDGGDPFADAHRGAITFLLGEAGMHWKAPPGAEGHDPSIAGWAWVRGTHSWVAPTSLAVMALKTAGRGDHPRVGDAVRMLLDRQLPDGGWNYGNTVVFGATLRPIPEDTGLALSALAGSVGPGAVDASLRYLRAAVETVRTPSSLSWGISGLSAWGKRPAGASAWIAESMGMERRLGGYPVRSLAELVVAFHAERGWVGWLDSTD